MISKKEELNMSIILENNKIIIDLDGEFLMSKLIEGLKKFNDDNYDDKSNMIEPYQWKEIAEIILKSDVMHPKNIPKEIKNVKDK